MSLFSRQTQIPVYVHVPRKAGTHLLRALCEALGMRCHSLLTADAATGAVPRISSRESRQGLVFALANVPPPRSYEGECEAGRTKIVLGIRDPRAVFLSTVDFLDHRVPLPSPDWHPVQFYRTALSKACATREHLARALLDPTWLPGNPFDVGTQFARCRLLYHHPRVLTIRYEDLVNAAAVGTDSPLRIACDYLGLTPPTDGACLLQKVIGSSTATKNKGVPDRWRTELPPEILNAFMDRYRGIVEEFGYPVD